MMTVNKTANATTNGPLTPSVNSRNVLFYLQGRALTQPYSEG